MPLMSVNKNGVLHDRTRKWLPEITLPASTIGAGSMLTFSLTEFGADGWKVFASSILLAGTTFFGGALLGLLFALPNRAVLKDKESISSDVKNSNLIEISEWLTKMIIGVTLIQLHSIPEFIRKLSYYLQPLLGNKPESGTFGMLITAFFFVFGFLIGYISCRIFPLQEKTKSMTNADYVLDFFFHTSSYLEKSGYSLSLDFESDLRKLLTKGVENLNERNLLEDPEEISKARVTLLRLGERIKNEAEKTNAKQLDTVLLHSVLEKSKRDNGDCIFWPFCW